MKLTTPEDIEISSIARKRRIESRNLQRCGTDEDSKSSIKRFRYDSASSLSDADDLSHANHTLRGIKKHARYVPGVPMTKAELSAWRKEARRVRNRESAAASRMKTRSRIEELEGEVDRLQAKYLQALHRIADLENNVCDSFTPDTLRQDMIKLGHLVSLSSSEQQRAASVTVSPPQSPRSEPFFIPEDLDQPQLMDMFSRSTEV